jgi:uncharacterized protein YndB with AHSA1/START domain
MLKSRPEYLDEQAERPRRAPEKALVKRDLKFEAVYPNRMEEVWHALTDSGSLADWLMENDFKPLPGHKFHFRSRDLELNG